MAIKLADTLAPMANFPAAMAKDVWFSDNESLQEKFDNGDFSSSGELHGATIAITSTSVELIGQRVTLSKNGAVVKTRTFNENLMCNFTGIQEAGEYTVSASDGETLKEKTVTVTSDDVLNKTVITVEIQLGDRLQDWIEAGRVTQSFSTLDEVLASEITVRQLMTIHASVDVLKGWMISEPEIVDTFVANATAMKWMGLRDYAYDTLTAGVDGLEEKILASDNWEYALKDHVPVMTSNTAPYGEAIAISELDSNHPSYKAFDSSDSSTFWHSNVLHSPDWFWVGYRFINPIRVNRVVFLMAGGRPVSKIDIQGSFDGENWETIHSSNIAYGSAVANDNREYSININNDMCYTRYRLRGYVDYLEAGAYAMAICGLQFYGRSLNVSVPKMTSNTAPYGEAIASSEYVASAGKLEAYQPFAKRDKNKGDVGGSQWASVKNSGIGEYIGYDFKKSVVVKQLYYAMRSDISLLNDCDVVLEGFDGVSWNSIIKFTLKAKTEELIAFSNNQPYSKYRLIYESTNYASDNNCQVFGLQFYGVDYSEREFTEGSTMSYIYDHGIIFNDFIGGLNYVKYTNPSESLLEDTYARVGTNTILQTNNMVDLSKYNMLCVKSVLYNPTPTSTTYINVHCIWNVKISTWEQTGNSSIREGELKATAQDECGPTVRCLDVSSITKMCVVAMQCDQSATTEFTEWWLE